MEKTDILSRVNQITGRAETDIDDILLEALVEIADRTCILKTSATGTLSASTNTISKPAGLIVINAFDLDGDILDAITFEEYLANKLPGYVLRGSSIYVKPADNTDRSYTIYYSKKPVAVSELSDFGSEFQPAIVRLVASKVYDNYEITDKRNEQYALFENELAKLSIDDEMPVCNIRTYKGMRI